MKKLFSSVLVCAIVFSSAQTVFAADESRTYSNDFVSESINHYEEIDPYSGYIDVEKLFGPPNPEATIVTDFNEPEITSRVIVGDLRFLKNITASSLTNGQLRSSTVLHDIPRSSRIVVQATAVTSGTAATVGLGFFHNGQFLSTGSTTISSAWGGIGVGSWGSFSTGVMHPFQGYISNAGSGTLSANFTISRDVSR